MTQTGFIGAGTLGTALAVILSQKGYDISSVASRTRTSAEKLAAQVKGCRIYESNQEVADNADLIFITTPDDTIPRVAAEVKWRPGQSIVHCSGAASTDILEPAEKAGARVGTFHPLQTLASLEEAINNIPGSTFGIEGHGELLQTLRDMARSVGGNPIELKSSDKVLYHAAAVMACNYLVTLEKIAADLWQTFDVPRNDAVQALMPLLKGTINNLEKIGLPNCLTGPIARGDTGTIKNHLHAMKERAPLLVDIYKALGRETIPISIEKGKINPQQVEALKKVLD
jgi:predicted short-subunit dehydrogenase-like oxidoreductase (DUF2520 family)